MSKIVCGGLIQATLAGSTEEPIGKIKQAMIDKHLKMIDDAAKKKVTPEVALCQTPCLIIFPLYPTLFISRSGISPG